MYWFQCHGVMLCRTECISQQTTMYCVPSKAGMVRPPAMCPCMSMLTLQAWFTMSLCLEWHHWALCSLTSSTELIACTGMQSLGLLEHSLTSMMNFIARAVHTPSWSACTASAHFLPSRMLLQRQPRDSLPVLINRLGNLHRCSIITRSRTSCFTWSCICQWL